MFICNLANVDCANMEYVRHYVVVSLFDIFSSWINGQPTGTLWKAKAISSVSQRGHLLHGCNSGAFGSTGAAPMRVRGLLLFERIFRDQLETKRKPTASVPTFGKQLFSLAC